MPAQHEKSSSLPDIKVFIRNPHGKYLAQDGSGLFFTDDRTSAIILSYQADRVQEQLETIQRTQGLTLAADPVLRQRLAQHFLEVEITRLNNWRTLTRLRRREPLGPESSFVKLFWSEMSQRMHDTAMALMGPFGLLVSGARAVRAGRLQRSYLYYRAATIFAGTSEIQRNIIAQRILGLPRE